jgi:GH25 family lysozyme M1 (1,4-beta-N-acetylmuramidase)
MLGAALFTLPHAALAQRPLGIDVSHYQGANIVWQVVKSSGISFAYAKATEGDSYVDDAFTNNVIGTQKAGVLIGAYHYARYDKNLGLAGATNEANHFWSVAGAYIQAEGSYLMPMLDAEWIPPSHIPSEYGYSKDTFSQWCNAWCLVVSNNAYAAGVTIRPVLYSGRTFASAWLDSTTTQWIPWISDFNGQGPQTGSPGGTSPWSTWVLWQYSSCGSIPGIGTCTCSTGASCTDVDVFNGTAAGLKSTLVIGGGNGATPVGSSVPGSVLTGQVFTATITMNNNSFIA